jgi:hypothetical protein
MEPVMSLDPTVAKLREEVQKARAALIKTSRDQPEHWWSPREIKAVSKNGWSYGATGLALNSLIDDGTFDVSEHKVRISH